MKTYQFLLILGILICINSNVEDNEHMKKVNGMLGPVLIGSGIGMILRNWGKEETDESD